MDNFNALSKSAILTKLALDGYFIDLLTLNTFIQQWNIEAIYENEFGIEFFDNNSYTTILNNLKEKYKQTKDSLEGALKNSYVNKPEVSVDIIGESAPPVENSYAAPVEEAFEETEAQTFDQPANAPLEELQASNQEAKEQNQEDASVIDLSDLEDVQEEEVQTLQENPISEENLEEASVEALGEEFKQLETARNLEELAKQAEALTKIEQEKKAQEIEQVEQNIDEAVEASTNEIVQETEVELNKEVDKTKEIEPEKVQMPVQKAAQKVEIVEEDDSIMPFAMRGLTPAPVTPGSNIHVDYDYIDRAKAQNDLLLDGSDEELNDIIDTDFSREEIERANELIKSARVKKEEEAKAKAALKDIPHQASKLEQKQEEQAEDMDLMMLAQSFAKNLTKGTEAKPEPADLDKIFDEPCTEQFEDLQEYAENAAEIQPSKQAPVKEEKVKEASCQEKPAQKAAEPKKVENKEVKQKVEQSAPANKAEQTNLTPKDIREIIREEISRQTGGNLPANVENTRDIVEEIVKQTAEKMPQNAFKLDISNRTLDMVAKAIAKKIAIQLNDYYKLNITKQNSKLEMYREKTLELKEKNQKLAEDNKKLRMLLLETNRNLNSYKPAMFGLFKFEGKGKTPRKKK